MLRYVTMNLFDSPAQTLVNAVNTVGIMGKGIAADFKKRYPDMFRKYRRYCDAGTLDIGKLYLYKSPNKWVLNLPTKKHWRYPSKVEYVEAGLKKFVETYAESGITSISFPQLGTGNGGLDWTSVVRPLMEQYLNGVTIPVYVHVARKPTDFVPEHLDREEVRALRAPRVTITFRDFLRDLHEHAEIIEAQGPTLEDEAPLPSVRFSKVEIPGEELEFLWEEIKLRGAIASPDYPPTIAKHAVEVTRGLLELGYLRPISFAQGRGVVPGLRFAPREDSRAHEAQSGMFAALEPSTP